MGDQGQLLEPANAGNRLAQPAEVGTGEHQLALPVARVLLDVPAPHLAREFDYAVPASLDEKARPGVRVKAKFGRQELGGFVTARLPRAGSQPGVLTPLTKVVSTEPVLTDPVLALARAVANWYGGTAADVLRFAIPPRHARAEIQAAPAAVGPLQPLPESLSLPEPWRGAWHRYPKGASLLAAIEAAARTEQPEPPAQPEPANQLEAPEQPDQPHQPGQPSRLDPPNVPSPRRFVWTALPGLAAPVGEATVPHLPMWAADIAVAAAAARHHGHGVLIVAPDERQVTTIAEALNLGGVANVERLTAQRTPEARCEAFLRIERGQARVVVGTRGASFAPVAGLGLIVLWDDDDAALVERRAPYFHARDVLAIRADISQVPLLVGSLGRSAVTQHWLETGQALALAGTRDAVKARAPQVEVLDAGHGREANPSRVPAEAISALRAALTRGPVLVQVPRLGYLPGFACQSCGDLGRCQRCGAALRLADTEMVPQCAACGDQAPGWRCARCGSNAIRAVRVWADRTAEELGRALPGIPVVTSTSSSPGGIKPAVPREPAIVIATPGAEPVAAGGYQAALVLEAGAATAQAALDTSIRAAARWLAVAHLVVPRRFGGRVLLVGAADAAAADALVRFDPATLARRELAARAEAELPPFARMAQIMGDAGPVAALLARLPSATAANTFGPAPLESGGVSPDDDDRGVPGVSQRETLGQGGALFVERPVQAMVKVAAEAGGDLAAQVQAALALRSAKREPGRLKVVLDPPL